MEENWEKLQRAFESKLTQARTSMHAPRGLADAAVYVNDTLELAWRSAQNVFGNKATPDAAIEIFKLMDAERHRQIQEDPDLVLRAPRDTGDHDDH